MGARVVVFFCVATEEEVDQRQVQRLVRIEEKVQNQEDKHKQNPL